MRCLFQRGVPDERLHSVSDTGVEWSAGYTCGRNRDGRDGDGGRVGARPVPE